MRKKKERVTAIAEFTAIHNPKPSWLNKSEFQQINNMFSIRDIYGIYIKQGNSSIMG